MTHKLAFIGFGEAGQHMTDGLIREAAPEIAVWDILFADPTRGPAMRNKARAIGARPAESAADAMAGAQLGIGQYKGYGLAFMTDVLTGVLGGGGFGLKPYSDQARLDVSHSLTAIDIAWFMPLGEFRARMDEFAAMVKSRQLRPGFSEILLPAEHEARRVARKSGHGVPLDDAVLDDLRALGAELGLKAEIAVVGPYTDRVL